MSMECQCQDWRENIKILNSSLALSSGHRFQELKKSFIYCPYCGHNLEEIEDKRESKEAGA